MKAPISDEQIRERYNHGAFIRQICHEDHVGIHRVRKAVRDRPQAGRG